LVGLYGFKSHTGNFKEEVMLRRIGAGIAIVFIAVMVFYIVTLFIAAVGCNG
jgi:hypothetical protein